MTLSLHAPPLSPAAPAVGLAVAAMISMQLGAALSLPFVAELGAPAFTWIRMSAAALLLLLLVRPRFRGRSRRDILSALLLGAALGVMSTATFAAVTRLPLGLVATIAFLGPLGVAAFGARNRTGLALALLAATGVALSVGTTGGGARLALGADPAGLALALIAAGGWAAYILLTRRVGACFSGLEGLSLSLLTTALVLAPTGLASLDRLPALPVLAGACGLALLAPILTCGAEMAALRRLGVQSFGVLMSLEPAVAMALGLVLLHQVPTLWQMAGTICVVVASAASVTLPQGKPLQE